MDSHMLSLLHHVIIERATLPTQEGSLAIHNELHTYMRKHYYFAPGNDAHATKGILLLVKERDQKSTSAVLEWQHTTIS